MSSTVVDLDFRFPWRDLSDWEVKVEVVEGLWWETGRG